MMWVGRRKEPSVLMSTTIATLQREVEAYHLLKVLREHNARVEQVAEAWGIRPDELQNLLASEEFVRQFRAMVSIPMADLAARLLQEMPAIVEHLTGIAKGRGKTAREAVDAARVLKEILELIIETLQAPPQVEKQTRPIVVTNVEVVQLVNPSVGQLPLRPLEAPEIVIQNGTSSS